MKIKLCTSVIIWFYTITIVQAQNIEENYKKAEAFLPINTRKLVKNMTVIPKWKKDGNYFIYERDGENGKQITGINPETKQRTFNIDLTKLIALGNTQLGSKFDINNHPFKNLKAVSPTSFEWIWEDVIYNFNCTTNTITKKQKTFENNVNISPNGKWEIFQKDFNLWLKATESSTQKQLTFDGSKEAPYALPLPDPHDAFDVENPDLQPEIEIKWSADSKKIATYRRHNNNAGTLSLYQSSPKKGGRPLLYTYIYPQPGDSIVPQAELLFIDIENAEVNFLPVAKADLLYYGGASIDWMDDSKNLYFMENDRGYKNVSFKVFNIETKKVTTVLTESSKTVIDPWVINYNFKNSQKELVYLSEKSGWAQLYSYSIFNKTSEQALTKGEFVVRTILGCDDKNKVIYFTASGKEKNTNLYFKHFYKINYDGSNLTLLTNANADHRIELSPDYKYFIDSYSTTTIPPTTLLCDTQKGEAILTLEIADVSELTKMGYKGAEEFVVKARDGKTDIYGVIYKPSNFDAQKKYPVIDKIYTGPHGFFAPKNYFAYQSDAQSIAELGFIVIQIDGLGTAKRSKAFHDFSYQNLTDSGLTDHVKGLQQLGTRFPWMDLSRVGVYGFSAGGYDAANALFSFPDFYKVGVAASGNHHHKTDKADWNEVWLGFDKIDKLFPSQSNLSKVKNLKGKLFIIHGELDNNVNPASSLQLVNALIEANKDFDFLIMPNQDHFLDKSMYYTRKRFDYFVKHLLNQEPPSKQ
ncbi:MAG: DPP IV N-terminal domain-containing protein [Limnohabitans sp.]|nr:DPP IV N-terminal domain-containing protein [Limnohabitans sp.]